MAAAVLTACPLASPRLQVAKALNYLHSRNCAHMDSEWHCAAAAWLAQLQAARVAGPWSPPHAPACAPHTSPLPSVRPPFCAPAVKSSNVLLTNRGVAKLCDVGLSRMQARGERPPLVAAPCRRRSPAPTAAGAPPSRAGAFTHACCLLTCCRLTCCLLHLPCHRRALSCLICPR